MARPVNLDRKYVDNEIAEILIAHMFCEHIYFECDPSYGSAIIRYKREDAARVVELIGIIKAEV
jgi:hypothetical protein